MSNLADHFSERGSLARAIPGFSARPQQVEMAVRIGDALREHRVLVAEAGTGTGKTFAYLVPALLAGGKLIISTGTKTLQDQLFKRDLPTVRAALKVPVDVALLKGRANYVCPYHLERNGREGRFQSPQDAADLRLIARFAEITQSGDKAECPEVPEDSAAWLSATSTRDNCLGQECQYYKDDCFVLKARKRAMEADVVVVNHHLFFADVMLRDEGMGELLPAANAVIFDEAHQLPETASLFFGENVTTSQLLDLARDTRSETVAAARDFVALIDATRALEKAARDLRLAVKAENARFGYTQMRGNDEFMAALEGLGGELVVRDHGSTNGTVVNGTLVYGDVAIFGWPVSIEIGPFRVEISPAEEESTLRGEVVGWETGESTFDPPPIGATWLDTMNWRLVVDGEVALDVQSAAEFTILNYLCSVAPGVVSAQDLGDAVWGAGQWDFSMLQGIIAGIRGRLTAAVPGRRVIVNVPGSGYRIE